MVVLVGGWAFRMSEVPLYPLREVLDGNDRGVGPGEGVDAVHVAPHASLTAGALGGPTHSIEPFPQARPYFLLLLYYSPAWRRVVQKSIPPLIRNSPPPRATTGP